MFDVADRLSKFDLRFMKTRTKINVFFLFLKHFVAIIYLFLSPLRAQIGRTRFTGKNLSSGLCVSD